LRFEEDVSMNRDQKATVVEEIAEQIRSADAIFAVDYRGISVAQAADLRSRLRDSGARFRIVKNSLTERAADEAGASALKDLLTGPTALAFVTGDAAVAAKALNDAARTLHTLEFKGGLMDATALSAADVAAIARLPAREVLNAQLVGVIASPLTGLVRGLNALIAGLAIQLKAIADQGLVSGEASAAPAAPEAEREDEPTAAATPDTTPAPDVQDLPAAEAAASEASEAAASEAVPEAEAAPEASEAETPTEPIVDVEAEPGAAPPPGETDEDVAPDEQAGA
jgi:large subunit ribosomal protein L10